MLSVCVLVGVYLCLLSLFVECVLCGALCVVCKGCIGLRVVLLMQAVVCVMRCDV